MFVDKNCRILSIQVKSKSNWLINQSIANVNEECPVLASKK